MKLNITYEQDLLMNVFKWTPKPYMEPLHYHSSLEIGYCVTGTGKFYFGEKCYSVQPGDLFIVNNSEIHIAQSDENNPSTYIFLNFDPTVLETEEPELLLPFAYHSNYFQNHISADAPSAVQIGECIESIWREFTERKEGYRSMVKSLLLKLCVILLRKYSQSSLIEDRRKPSRSYSQLHPVMTYIEKHFQEPLYLKDIAEKLTLSPSRVSHLIKEHLGKNFKDHLTLLRLNEAKRKLISTNTSITEICFNSGFQSTASFYRTFKAKEGRTPIDYRNEYSFSAIYENQEQL